MTDLLEEIKKINSIAWDELLKEVNRLLEIEAKLFTYCAYCGAQFRADGDSSKVSNHIAICEKHPMRQIEAEAARLRTVLRKYFDYLGVPPTGPNNFDSVWEDMYKEARKALGAKP